MRGAKVIATLASVAVLSAGCASTTSGSGGGAPSYQGTYVPLGSGTPGATTTASGQSLPVTVSSATSGSSAPSVAGSGPASASPSVVHPVPATPIRTATVHGANGVTYVIDVWAQTQVQDCATHAYGAPVIAYLKAHPCYGLSRTLATTTVNGRAVGLSSCAIGFAGQSPTVYQTAGDFNTLVTANGTGSLNDLLREGYRLPSGPTSVPSPDAFDALSQDNGVTVDDAWYLSGPTPNNDPPLVAMEQNTYLQY
jgi:hypothetical protein